VEIAAGNAVGELIGLGDPEHVGTGGEQRSDCRGRGGGRAGLGQIGRDAGTHREAGNVEQILNGDRLSTERTGTGSGHQWTTHHPPDRPVNGG
jgi:hypothetical protein